MGMETYQQHFLYQTIYFLVVKLNDPHYGAETCFVMSYVYRLPLELVELNNPHYGTETPQHRVIVHQGTSLLLN